MKRLITLSLMTFLAIGAAANVWADDYNYIYYETVVNDQTDYADQNCDWTQYMLTADISLDNFKIGLEGRYGELDFYHQDQMADYLTYKLKGGFALINNDAARLDLTGGYFNSKYQDGLKFNEICYDSMFLGLDLRLILSERVWFDANYTHGMNPVVKTEAGALREHLDMDRLTTTNFRLSLLLTEDTALSFGYTYDDYNTSDQAPNNATNTKNKGYTLGLAYRF